MQTKSTPATLFDRIIEKYSCRIYNENGLKKAFIYKKIDALKPDSITKINEVNRLLEKTLNTVPVEFFIVTYDGNQTKIRLANRVSLKGWQTVENPFSHFPEIKTSEFFACHFSYQIDIGEEGEAWVHCKQSQKKSWPATLADFTRTYRNAPVMDILSLITDIWGETSGAWKAIKPDLLTASECTAIPVKFVYTCNSKNEVLTRWYGNAPKNADDMTIGDGIFFAKASKLVDEKNWHILRAYHSGGGRYSNRKEDLAMPLAEIMSERIHSHNKVCAVSTGKGIVHIHTHFLLPAVSFAIKSNEKIPIDITSAEEVYDWAMKQFIAESMKEHRRIMYCRDSQFLGLKMPENCVKLETKKALFEESLYQNIDLSEYIEPINKDKASVWSYRGKERYTIILHVRNKRFKISGMYGKNGCITDKVLYEQITDEINRALSGQTPHRSPYKTAAHL